MGCSSSSVSSCEKWTEISRKGFVELEDLNYSRLEELNDNKIDFTYDQQTNQLKKIDGCYTTVVINDKGDALQSLSNVRSLFGITDYSFYCSFFEKRDSCFVIELQQLYKNIWVDNGYFRIVTDPKGVAMSIEGHYVPNIDINTHARFTAQECANMADIKQSRINDIKLCVIEQDPTCLLCWKISAECEIYYLNSNSGELIRTVSTMIN